MERKTLPCGLYEYTSPLETDVVFFFEVQVEDDFEMIGWAKFDASRRGWLKRPPTESQRLVNDLPDEIRECWEVVDDKTPDDYPYTAEITHEDVKIYKDGNLWLTLN